MTANKGFGLRTVIIILAALTGPALMGCGDRGCFRNCSKKDQRCLKAKVAACDSLLRAEPENVEAYIERGNAYYDLGRASRAEEDFDQAESHRKQLDSR